MEQGKEGMGILFRAECAFRLTSLAASDHAVWALREVETNGRLGGGLVVRVGLKHCAMGTDWVEETTEG